MAVLFTLLLGLSALLLGYFLVDFGRQNFTRETQAAIDSEFAHLLAVMQPMDTSQRAAFIETKTRQSPHPLYWLEDKDGLRLAGHLQSKPASPRRIAEGVIGFDADVGGLGKRALAAKIHTFDDGSRLLIARDIETISASHTRLKWISALILSFMLIVISVSFFISLFVVRRINQIAETARDIMETGDLSRRIHVDGRWDDLSNLAYILNALLSRIDELMLGMKEVSNSIAHDLRTPLTRLRQQLEQLHLQSQQPEQTAPLLAEADRILATFQALLRIANIEKRKQKQQFRPLNLSLLLRDVIELYEPLAEEKNIALREQIEPEIQLSGDRDFLFQALANLLDNAIKFSPENAQVSLALIRCEGRLQLTIRDGGCGIDPRLYDKVFERFYRADSSRSTEGTGLGLSLVKAVIDLHQGSIALSDNQPGLVVTLTL